MNGAVVADRSADLDRAAGLGGRQRGRPGQAASCGGQGGVVGGGQVRESAAYEDDRLERST
jgi:hypothetical protein